MSNGEKIQWAEAFEVALLIPRFNEVKQKIQNVYVLNANGFISKS
jgi:hypothetical protein